MDPKQTPPQTGGQAGLPKMAGELGAENLSTGANVARTMNSLNDQNQSAIGAPVFAKHKFDKIEYATGDIILQSDVPKPKGLFSRLFGGKKSSEPQVKSAAEISREARREAKRLRKLRASADNPVGTSTPSNAPVDASAPSNTLGGAPSVSAAPSASTASGASTTPSRPRTTRIAVIAIIVVLIVAAGILGFIALSGNNSKKQSNSNSSVVGSVTSAEAAFSDYLSYLFYGDEIPSGDLYDNFAKTWTSFESDDWMYDSNDEYNPNAEQPIYAETVMDSSSMTNQNRGAYFDELNNKWEAFLSNYNGDLKNTPRQTDVSLYFYNLAKVGNLKKDDILDIYRRNKDSMTEEKNTALEEVMQYIKVDSEDIFINDYYSGKIAYYTDLLDSYAKANAECGDFWNSNEICVTESSGEATVQRDINDGIKDTLKSNAMIALMEFSEQIIGDTGSGEL